MSNRKRRIVYKCGHVFEFTGDHDKATLRTEGDRAKCPVCESRQTSGVRLGHRKHGDQIAVTREYWWQNY